MGDAERKEMKSHDRHATAEEKSCTTEEENDSEALASKSKQLSHQHEFAANIGTTKHHILLD